jgi:hypothetical protein
MTDYNDGKWHGWNGGECPVHPESIVEVATLSGTVSGETAEQFFWSGDQSSIIAFRVTKTHVEPREWWAVSGQMYQNKSDAESFLDRLKKDWPDTDFGPIIHVREVIE